MNIATTLLIILYSAVLGAIFGSFVTALVYRQRQGISMWQPHSACPHCQHQLSYRDLVPIASYLWHRGRCRHCGHDIGREYIATEIFSLLVFVGMGLYLWFRVLGGLAVDWWLAVGVAGVLVTTVLMIALAVYDLRWGELPNAWTLGGASLMLLLLVMAWVSGQPLFWQPQVEWIEPSIVATVVTGLVSAIGFWLVNLASQLLLKRQGMGMGDVKLVLFMGLFLGWPAMVVALYVAFILGAMLSLLLIAGKRKSLGASLPFGPFLIVGFFLSIWISPVVIAWYRSFLL